MPVREHGWECPKCQRIWAPKINACMACNDRGTLDHVPMKPVDPGYGWRPQWNFTAEDPSFTHD